MNQRDRLLWGSAAAVVALLLVWWLFPVVEERLAPEPQCAWVAIEAEGSGVARSGTVRLAAGAPFRLHAVLEAQTSGGERVFYTEARALRLGDEEIPPSALRRWEGRRPAKVRWFSVEGFSPYLEVAAPSDLERFHLEEFFHPDWPAAWSIPGGLEFANGTLDSRSLLRPLPFGTQRFHVRIELFSEDNPLTPEKRYSSPGAERVGREGVEIATAILAMEGPLGPSTRLFGLTEIDPREGTAPELMGRIEALHDRGLAFTRTLLLRDALAAVDRRPQSLEWRAVDLAVDRLSWGKDVAPGDWLQAGPRLVILLRDGGTAGELDAQDLCLDFERGARVLRIGEVFASGPDALPLELASLRRANSAGASSSSADS